MTLIAEVPKDSRYPKSLETLGDHIRSKRLDLYMEIQELAKKFDVSITSIVDWEQNRKKPSFCYYPDIFSFLEYEPEFIGANKKFIQQFDNYRKQSGLSIYYCANQMRMCPKQLKKVINYDVEISNSYKKRMLTFLKKKEITSVFS